MVDTRRSASAKSKAKSSASTKQRTLFDLFPVKSTPATPAPAEQVTQDESAQPTPVPSTSTSTNTEDTVEVNIAPVVEKLRQTSLEPRPLHPFFTKPALSLSSPSPVEPLPKQDIIIEIKDDETPSGPASAGADSITLIEESGSQEDPIIVETKPLKPLRPSKASVSKPLAPLFAPRRPKAAPVPSPSQSPEVVLLELPDEIVKPKLAPIFASRPSKAAPSSNTRLAKTKEVVAPFPNKESQHVRGPQHVFTASGIPYGRLAKHGPSSTPTSYEVGSLKQLLTEKNITPSTQISTTTSISLDRDTYLDTIPNEHREHPAISRFTTASQPEGSAHRLWVDKWRPTRAVEILGNEDNAIYLRDWIHALELHLETNETSKEEENPGANVKGKGKAKAESSRGTKRPRTIVREVEKKRGKKKRRVDSEDEDDSWIVYDTDYFSSPAPSSPPPYDGASSPVSRAPTDLGSLTEPIFQHDHHTFTSLTNTILLVGPTGSGKTAAVYACAEELGWDVLEVYPGIGRRNGAGIDSLIGDAGKNHHVRKARTGNAGVPGISDLCGSHHLTRGKENDTRTPKGDDCVETVSTDTGPLSSITTDSMLGPPSVRQSLILLEEVDILFKDDTNFWSAVTNFIKECRRPVICTCNDISLVPTQDLPLQTILTFEPCAPQLAVSYLQALCFHEDHTLLNRETLLRVYEDSASKVGDIDLPDIPNPATRGDFPSADLRRTINSLQFLCTSASGNQASSGWEPDEEDREDDMCDWNRSWGNDPKKMSADQGVSTMVMRVLAARQAELVSYVDTYLRRGPWDTREGLGWSTCEASNDDEVGHATLFCPRAATRSWFGESCDTEMRSAAVWLARGAGTLREPTSVCISPCRTRELFRARVDHQLGTGEALDGMVPLSMMTMRRKEVHLDYVSRVREIVAAEDEWEKKYVERERTGRMTRNSGGTYERNVLVSSQAREALGRTVLSQI